MYKRALTIQDISCVGQCSLTVALPIISACGVETCVLPSAVLSTHTGGFSGFTFRDLTDDMPAIKDHWIKEGISFDAIYTGYLGSTRQIEYVKDIIESVGKDGCARIIDPAMADNGKLYYGFDAEFVSEMKKLCAVSDYVLPNITEACFLTGIEYRENGDEEYANSLVDALVGIGCKNVILKGVCVEAGKIGILMHIDGERKMYVHERHERSCHGTGDVYASAFTGALLRGKDAYTAASIAGDYALECIKETVKLDNHWYGAAFELAIGKLIQALQ